MTRRNITKETQKAFDEAITDLLSSRYEDANQRYKDVSDDLKNRLDGRHHGNRFRPYYWVAGFGQGLAEGMIEKSKSEEVGDISDIAKEANNFYNAFISLAGFNENQHEVYRSLGKSYASLGLEQEGVKVLEQLRRPRLLDIARISVKAKELLGNDKYQKGR